MTRSHRHILPAPRSAARANWFGTAAVSVVIAASILITAQPIASWLGERPIVVPSVEPRPDEPLPIVRASEVQLARARDLYASGRLRDALLLLDQIAIADPLRPDAERLRADLQRDLFAASEAAR